MAPDNVCVCNKSLVSVIHFVQSLNVPEPAGNPRTSENASEMVQKSSRAHASIRPHSVGNKLAVNEDEVTV